MKKRVFNFWARKGFDPKDIDSSCYFDRYLVNRKGKKHTWASSEWPPDRVKVTVEVVEPKTKKKAGRTKCR